MTSETTLAAPTDQHMAEDYLRTLFTGAPGWLPVAYKPRSGSFVGMADAFEPAKPEGLTQAAELIGQLDGDRAQGVFVQMTTVAHRPPAGQRGRAEDALAIPALWADLDVGTVGHSPSRDRLPLPEDEKEGRAILRMAGLPEPTLWVHSGGGLYPLWQFVEIVLIAKYGRERVQKLMRTWQQIILDTFTNHGRAFDAGVGADLARILRVPGTVNRKAGIERPTSFEHGAGRRYTFEELEAYAAKLATPVQPAAAPSATQRERGPFDALAETVTFNDLLTREGWQHCGQRHGPDIVECWTRPGNPENSCSAHVLAANPHVIVVWSEAADLPTGGGQKMTVGRLFANLYHGGDESAAARDLRAAALGEPSSPAAAALPAKALDAIRATVEAPDDDPDDMHGNQMKFAVRLAKSQANKLIYVHGLGWHYWDGKRWALDDNGVAKRAVYDELRAALAESLNDKDLRNEVRRVETAKGVDGILELAEAKEPLSTRLVDLDPDPYLLNVANGTLDLRTFELRPHNPADRITKLARGAYDPNATGHRWPTFLEEVLPNKDVREFLRRYVGLGLVGVVRKHLLAIATGEGRNGKGALDRAVRYMLGDYGIAGEPDLFLHREGGHPTGEMDLRGVRWVVVSESDKDRRLAEATVKRLTGGDPIRARRMRQDFVEFQPSHTAMLITNHLPKVSGDDPALWARLRVIPFDVSFEGREDDDLDAKLELDADAILSWAVQGWRDYTEHGMAEPDAVLVATENYRKQSDVVSRFIASECIINKQEKVPFMELFQRFERWRQDDGAEPVSRKQFGLTLDKLGFPLVRAPGYRARRGLQLKPDEDGDIEDGVV